VTAPATRKRGRPADAQISERALAAARQLLVDVGFEATTLQAIAVHAGVHASALYRRWPSRIELIQEATFPGLDPLAIRPTGDLRRDLRRFVRAYVAALDSPALRAAAGGLTAHTRGREAHGPSEVFLRTSARPAFRAILAAAPGSVAPDIDPDDAFDLLLGAVVVRTMLASTTGRRRPIERTVDLLVRMLAPAAG